MLSPPQNPTIIKSFVFWFKDFDSDKKAKKRPTTKQDIKLENNGDEIILISKNDLFYLDSQGLFYWFHSFDTFINFLIFSFSSIYLLKTFCIYKFRI